MSPRPGRVNRIVDVDLPQPRTFETREARRYFELVTEVREALRGFEEAAAEDEVADARIRAEGIG
jgi:ABC-type nitrate/sulfonate/bicarbonate transport system ATPase subunit